MIVYLVLFVRVVVLYLYSLTKYNLPIPRQKEARIVVPFVVMLREPKNGNKYNPCICAKFLSIE